MKLSSRYYEVFHVTAYLFSDDIDKGFSFTMTDINTEGAVHIMIIEREAICYRQLQFDI